jgi:hypothetical protein
VYFFIVNFFSVLFLRQVLREIFYGIRPFTVHLVITLHKQRRNTFTSGKNFLKLCMIKKNHARNKLNNEKSDGFTAKCSFYLIGPEIECFTLRSLPEKNIYFKLVSLHLLVILQNLKQFY